MSSRCSTWSSANLRRHYRSEYRIIKVDSGIEALNVVQQIKQRNDPLALFLVDQRMPQMSGTDFLTQAGKFFPQMHARSADRLRRYTGRHRQHQHHRPDYLMKPDRPEQQLFPVLDDLLSDWWQNTPPPFDGIRVVGTLWSPKSHDVKDFLARATASLLPVAGTLNRDSTARQLVDATLASASDEHTASHRLPVVFFPDGTLLIEPDLRTLADKVGLWNQVTQPFYDLIVVGAGPAGLGGSRLWRIRRSAHTDLFD